MTRGVRLYLVGSFVLVSLAGCGRGFFQSAEREPWRREAEVACLKSGSIKETADLVRVSPISGPGVCGAEFPLKVASLGESNGAFGFADELRPPAGIGRGQPRWPVNDPPQVASQPPSSYPSPSYPPPQAYPSREPYAAQARASAYPPSGNGPVSLSAPGINTPEPDEPDPEAEETSPPQRGYGQKGYGRRGGDGYRTPLHNDRAAAPRAQPPDGAPPRLGRGNAVGSIGPVSVQPPATLACPIVSALDRWIADAIQPAATRWLGARVVEIKQISAYSCRGMNGNRSSQISEHAFGNALDISAFVLADGRRISVKDGWKGLPEEQGFLREIQSAACQQFNTVLAPGSNIYHYDHIHVDMMRRNSGRVICQPSALSADQIASRATPRGGYASRDGSITGSITQNWKRVFSRAPLSKEDRDTIEDESNIRYGH